MSQEIRDFFMEEASELFDNLNSILLKNEEAGDISSDEIDSLFRDMHTLKGGAGSVEMMKFSAYTHHLETFMDMVKNGEIELNPKVIDFLIESVGVMQEILDAEYEESLDEAEYQEHMSVLLKNIDAIKNGKIAKESGDESFQKAKEIKESNEKIFGESAAEMIDLFSEWETIISSIGDKELDINDVIDKLFRVVHTIKGSSLFLNLTMFPNYMHEIEYLLDQVREGEIEYSDELNNFLEDSIMKAQIIIDKELNGELQKDVFKKELEHLKEEIAKNFQSKEENKPLAFELFDEELKEEPKQEKVAFELFDEEPQIKESSTSNATPAFELFDDEVKTEEAKKEEEPKKSKVSKKVDTKKSPKKSDRSLSKSAASTSIRVNLDKIDQLMNRVGDLVITKSMLFQFSDSIEDSSIYKEISEKLLELDRDIRELQESVMSVRMVPMESVYSRLPKMVRDLAKKLDKKVKFEHLGDSVEIDKMMVEGLMDPLTHIIRNSMDHGIEKPDERYKKGKPETGKLIISAQQESGNIIISIKDDGAGINIDKVVQKALENGVITEDELSRMSEQDKIMLIFNPGLSTAEKVTDVSGRGVGMDVVMNNINSLGGYIKAFSTKDRGTEFQIYLPLTLAILDGLNVLIGDNKFILPLNAIVESLQPKANMIKHVGESKKEILMLRREFIPIIRLSQFFGLKPKYEKFEDGMLIVVNATSSKVALFVDDFLNQEQIVVKSLEKNYKKIKGIGAATIRGDGSIGLILDVASIVAMHKEGV